MKTIDFLTMVHERDINNSAYTLINAAIDGLSVLVGSDNYVQPLMRSAAMTEALQRGNDAPTVCISDDSDDGTDLITTLVARGYQADAVLSILTGESKAMRVCNYVCFLLQ